MGRVFYSHIVSCGEHVKGNRNICVTVLFAIEWYRVVTMS